MKLLILAKAAQAMPRDGDLIEFRSDRMTDKGPATGTVKTIKPTVDGFYVTVEFADGQATLSWDDMGAKRVKPGLWLVKASDIDAKYRRLLARRTDGTPEGMAAEGARLRDLVERKTGPSAVEAIRAADAEARAKVREDFGIEYASEGGYAAEVIDFHGLQVVIENPVGSVRAGIDPDGKPWATELTASYGYISGTEGADGDMVDVFIGPDASSTTAYVARCQVAGKWGAYDEDKVMLGFPSEEAAGEAFLQNYNDPRFLGGLDVMSIDKLKDRLGKPGRLAKSILILSKAHISAYTKKDGTFVPAHEDSRKSGNVAGMADANNVAGKQAPTPAGDVETGGAKPRYTARDWREWSELPEFQSDDESTVLFNHGRGGYINQVENGKFDTFDGIFALRAPGMVERGPDVTAFRIPDDKMLSQRDLNYDLDPDEVTSALLDVFPRKIEQGEESFDEAWKAIVEDRSDFESLGLEDDGSVRENSFMDTLGYSADDAGEASWFAQKLRGRLAQKLGYQAVEMDDENGTSWYIVPGVKSIPLPNESPASASSDARPMAKSLLIFTKAHVGPYLRGGKLVNLSGYQGRPARARATAGQMGLFADLPPAEKPKRKKADDMTRFDHETTGDLFADADEHGEVPPARVLMRRRDTVTESRQELIAEHERLVDVLRSPSHEDDKAEAKKQADELAEYKQGEHDHLLADIPGAKWRRGKGLIAGHYGVEVDGEVLGNYHKKPEDAVAAAKDWMAARASHRAESEKRAEAVASLRDRLLVGGGEVTDSDLKLLGLRPGSAGLEWFIPAAAEVFGISSRAVRPHIKDMIRVGHSDMGVKREFVSPKDALRTIAAAISSDAVKPILLLTSERKSANAQNVLTSASSGSKVEASEPSDTARRESGAQEKKMSGYTLEDLSKPDLYETDDKVKAAAKIVMNDKFPGGIGRGEWKAKVRDGGAASEVLAVLEEKAQAEQKAAKKASKAKADAEELAAPVGYTLTRENGEIVLRGPWSDDLHARLKRAGGKWEGSGHGTGRVGRKAWIIPEDKASSLKRIFANVGGALAAEEAGRKAAAQAEAEKAAAAKAEADRKQAEARAAAPIIAGGQYGPFTVRAVSGGYRVMFAYDSARVAQIKANGGKKYDPVEKSWFVDAADAGKLQSILERAKAAAAAAPSAPASSSASARKPRVLFPLSTMPAMGVPVTWRGRTVVFESKGEPFRINEDHPSLHGSHLLGYEGDRGAYAYYRDATPEEVQGMQADKNAPAEKSWGYSEDAVKRALEGRD